MKISWGRSAQVLDSHGPAELPIVHSAKDLEDEARQSWARKWLSCAQAVVGGSSFLAGLDHLDETVLLPLFSDRAPSTLKLDDEWPESIFHHVGSQSASYPVSVQ